MQVMRSRPRRSVHRRRCPAAAVRADGEVHQLVLRLSAPVVSVGSFLLGPSTIASSTPPDAGRGVWPAADRSTTTRRRSNRSATTSAGDESVRHRGGLGAGTRREDEGVRAVVLGRRHDLERVLEVVVGLAGEADDEVGGDREVGDRRPGRGQPLEIALARCSPDAWRPAPGRCPTATAGGGAGTPPGSRPWPRSSRAAGPWGAGWCSGRGGCPRPSATAAQQLGEQRPALA